MSTLFVGVGALLLAVFGCAVLDPRPSRSDQETDDQLIIDVFC
jgi:hypothetical protein